MSEIAEVTIQYVNDPKPGKKMGSIKTAELGYFGVFPNMLRQFSTNEVCRLEYETNGDFKKVTKKLASAVREPTKNIRPRSDPAESEQIFAVALAKEFIARGDVTCDTEQLVKLINVCRQTYRQTFGGTEAQRRDDMQDQVPY